MRCPYCRAIETRVVDSRELDESVRRRRECMNCHKRFTTHERFEPVGLLVIKKEGRREPYDRPKLANGVWRACTKRPVAAEAVEGVIDGVERDLFSLGKAEIPSEAIGEMVMDRLRALDPVAYIRFASVYRQFTDVKTMLSEITDLLTHQD